MSYKNKNNTLCKDFAGQAISTWTRLENSLLTALTFDEESLTDLNLQDLQLKHPYSIRTKKFNKQKQEPVNGADWEWWLISGSRGLGLRIQAKKLNLDTQLYPSVNKQNDNGFQIDLLIQDANRQNPNLIPIYVFYNYVDIKAVSLPWNCYSIPVDLKKLGCSIVPALVVRQMNINSISIDDIKKIMRPWHCLVCCEGYLTETDRQLSEISLPDRAFALIDNIIKRFEPFEPINLTNTVMEKGSYVTEKIPSYVNLFRESGRIDEEIIKRLNIDGLTIIEEK